MKKSRINQSLWISIVMVVVFMAVSVVGAFLLHRQQTNIDKLLTVRVESKGVEENISCWKNEEGNCRRTLKRWKFGCVCFSKMQG